jgi:IstB-like ATP binding protein
VRSQGALPENSGPVARLPETLTRPPTASALIDRVVHHAEILTIEGPSYRRRVAEATHRLAKAPAAEVWSYLRRLIVKGPLRDLLRAGWHDD